MEEVDLKCCLQDSKKHYRRFGARKNDLGERRRAPWEVYVAKGVGDGSKKDEH